MQPSAVRDPYLTKRTSHIFITGLQQEIEKLLFQIAVKALSN